MEIQEEPKKSKKIIWLLIILLILLIIAVLVYLFFTYFRQPAAVIIENTNINEPVTIEQVPTNFFNTPSISPLADVQGMNGQTEPPVAQEQNILLIANSFAERYGTFSNQSDYKNFDQLVSFMTESMQKYIIRYKADLIKQYPAETYFALETKAISNQVRSLDDTTGKGEILIKTQRQEFKGAPTNPRVFYQDILLKLVKVNNEWKVDGAYWQ